MKTRCPCCGASMSLDALLGHSDASLAFVASLNLTGELAKPLVKYLGLFRSENRDLSFERVAKLLNELAPDIAAQQIVRNRMSFAAPLPAWVWAIQTMLERRDQGKLQLPLKNHGYLYEVISSYKPEYAPATEAKAPRVMVAESKSMYQKSLEKEQSVDLTEHERLKHARPAFSFAELMAKAKAEKAEASAEKPAAGRRELKGIPQDQLLAHIQKNKREGETANACFERLKAQELAQELTGEHV